jgi:hypothetical protein
MNTSLPDIATLYAAFDTPVVPFDCGALCAPNNPRGVPFCCDLHWAVPAVFHHEWDYLRDHTDLWHEWTPAESGVTPAEAVELYEDTPDHMRLLACQGAPHCQRGYRSLSCRQFPFNPYLTSEMDFIGLVHEERFVAECWVLQHLDQVSEAYVRQFVDLFERLLADWPAEMESYYLASQAKRDSYEELGKTITLLHHEGGIMYIDPASEEIISRD